MKTIILSLLLLSTNLTLGQKIIIHAFERQELVSFSKTPIDSVILNPDLTMDVNDDYIKYVINLDELTSTYYINNESISELPINYRKLKNGLIKINILEGEFDYGLLINTDYNNESVTWFWFDTFTTTVKVFKKFVIEKPS